jgi:Tfp pilus assembly protein PilV
MSHAIKARGKTAGLEGFTIVELVCAMSILVIGLLTVAGVMVSMSRQQEHAASRRLVLAEAQSLLERMKGVAPKSIAAAYHGKGFLVHGVTGTQPAGNVITASIDDSNPNFLNITLTADWNAGGQDYTLILENEVYASAANTICN